MSHYRPRDGKDGIPGTHGKDGRQGDKGDIGPIPEHQWDGTALSFQEPDGEFGAFVDLKGDKGDKGDPGESIKGDPGKDGRDGKDGIAKNGKDGRDGEDGDRGEVGPMPEHQWRDTSIRFELPDGWGRWVDLKGPPGIPGASGGGGSIQHNKLKGIQGGTDGQYYHLTEAQHIALIENDPVKHISAFVAVSGFRHRTDTTAGSFTITVSPGFVQGQMFRVKDVAASWNDTNSMTVDFSASGYAYQGVMGDNFVGNVPNDGQTFVYIDPTTGFEQW